MKISLNAHIQRFVENVDVMPEIHSFSELGKLSFEIQSALSNNNVESILLKTKDGKVEKIEIDEVVDPNGRIVDLLKDESFQNISLKQRDSKVAHLRRTRIKKVEK